MVTFSLHTDRDTLHYYIYIMIIIIITTIIRNCTVMSTLFFLKICIFVLFQFIEFFSNYLYCHHHHHSRHHHHQKPDCIFWGRFLEISWKKQKKILRNPKTKSFVEILYRISQEKILGGSLCLISDSLYFRALSTHWGKPGRRALAFSASGISSKQLGGGCGTVRMRSS